MKPSNNLSRIHSLKKRVLRYSLPIAITALHTLSSGALQAKEKEVLKQLQLFPETIQQAAQQYSPALIANYTYDLVRLYNSFFQNIPIFAADTDMEKNFRIQLSKATGEVIKTAFGLLGITVAERM